MRIILVTFECNLSPVSVACSIIGHSSWIPKMKFMDPKDEKNEKGEVASESA